MIEAIKAKFPDYGLTYSIGGQLSFDMLCVTPPRARARNPKLMFLTPSFHPSLIHLNPIRLHHTSFHHFLADRKSVV